LITAHIIFKRESRPDKSKNILLSLLIYKGYNMITVDEWAARFRVSRECVIRQCRAGKLPCRKYKSGWRIYGALPVELMINLRDTSRICRTPRRTLNAMIQRGAITATKCMGRWFVPKSEVAAVMSAQWSSRQ
jgi:hypothetical protein